MKIYKEMIPRTDLPAFQQNYLTEDMLLFDIETTGLSPAKHQIYCIGCGYVHSENIAIELFFAENSDAEPQILKNFYDLLNKRKRIITFNGTTFDVPFIKKRTELLFSGQNFHSESTTNNFYSPVDSFYSSRIFDQKEAVDLYRETKNMRLLLNLTSYKQKAVEQFLGCYRKDQYHGGQLIDIYHKYIRQPEQGKLDLLLLHNLEDLKGMLDLLGVLSYRQFVNGQFQITDIIPETDKNCEYLNVKLVPDFPLPQSIHQITECAAILINKETTFVRFPVHHGTLKHFFPDPENYYYLPEEDTVVHKSIGEYVDPSHRKKASSKNCYIKKECDYIVIPVKSEHNRLRQECNDRQTYMEIPIQDMDVFKKFIQKLFHMEIK